MKFLSGCFSPIDESIEPLAHLRIPLSQILKATNNFDESLVIGKGGFGVVYKGALSNGAGVVTPVAIKRLSQKSKEWEAEFLSELRMLSRYHHSNLVTLIGYCCEDTKQVPTCVSSNKKETILVYEYASNGSLNDHLHDRRTHLSWHKRLEICLGAARGLDYLHTGIGTGTRIIHRDVKSSNILLDENWVAKVSDFGLSKIGPPDQPSARLLTFSKGSFGYLDPYSLSSGRLLTEESDVYSFGVVLFEILCGKRAVFDGQRSLVTWVQDSVKGNRMEKSPEFFKDIFGFSNRNSEDVIDPDLRNFLDIIDNDLMYEINPKSLKYYVGAAERCLHEIPKQRPNMSEVVRCLESALASQERINNGLQSTVENVKEFLFSDLEKATRGFSRDLLIGEGGFGRVYRGWLDEKVSAPLEKGVGTAVAVQLITSECTRLQNEWQEEVNFFGQLAHPNIISLLGFCNKNEHERLFVYEYMKTSLSHFIHGDYHLEPLSWDTRLKVMIGVARGLAHLYTTKGIMCHFQCSDILLDEDFNAKIGGFGWSKIRETHGSMRQKGAFGYLKADYDTCTGHLLMKSDICSFGLVLLETLTGRHLGNLDDVLEGLESLEIRAPKSRSNRRKLKKMLDPRLKGSYSIDGAFKCMALTLRCIAIQPEYRPSREEIVWSLEQIYSLNK